MRGPGGTPRLGGRQRDLRSVAAASCLRLQQGVGEGVAIWRTNGQRWRGVPLHGGLHDSRAARAAREGQEAKWSAPGELASAVLRGS